MREHAASFGLGPVLFVALGVLAAAPAGKAETRTVVLPATYQFFGPVQADGREVNTYGTTYVFIGDALTPSTKWFPFSKAFPRVESAIWKHTWTPNDVNTYVRLVHMDNGPANVTPIEEIQSNGSAFPVVETVDVTKAMNELINAKVDKHLGFQVKDDGSSSSSIYESRLEVVFQITF
jgi:hypothetical protein